MSEELLVREREPIERVRARLEAPVRANAAPRCGRLEAGAASTGWRRATTTRRSKRPRPGRTGSDFIADATVPRSESFIIEMAERTQIQLQVVPPYVFSQALPVQRSCSARFRLENARRS
jgi:hypothetical protein